ncbi:hypothetical protein EW146_g789 [Bondarzewia mesenterica]|uniref:Uncharacterized protein n=1 Tax=Bondarzewia mesenterica TaxID=1095465 RepID=A0A4S4M5T1_9AGAM|nr:hypothetical protein EW146_g789 [Bondarzewia mesenterica]
MSADLHVSTTDDTGSEATVKHAIWGFARPDNPNDGITLDLASMQFGPKGRGKGEWSFLGMDFTTGLKRSASAAIR